VVVPTLTPIGVGTTALAVRVWATSAASRGAVNRDRPTWVHYSQQPSWVASGSHSASAPSQSHSVPDPCQTGEAAAGNGGEVRRRRHLPRWSSTPQVEQGESTELPSWPCRFDPDRPLHGHGGPPLPPQAGPASTETGPASCSAISGAVTMSALIAPDWRLACRSRNEDHRCQCGRLRTAEPYS